MDASAMRPVVQISDLGVGFHGQPVLDGVSLDVAGGRFVCLVGRSGCGKTTLLRCLAGLQRPTAGTVAVPLTPTGRPSVAMVFQQDSLFPWMSAVGNVAFGLQSQGVRRRAALERAMTELERVGLADSAHKRPKALSGGMRQRVNLARALATDATLVLMDEPFSGLDYLTRETMQDLTSRLVTEDGKTVVFVTHDLDEACYLADDVFVMSQEAKGLGHHVGVPWPRPRSAALRQTTEFQASIATLRAHIA